MESSAGPDAAQFQRARSVLELKVRQGLAKRDAARYLVEDLLQFDCPISKRYKHLDVIRILRDNCSTGNPGIEALIHGLAILERYGKNLLRSERPEQWRAIRLSNSVFRLEVDIIKGSRELLRLLGYTVAITDGLSYPVDTIIPDVPKVASVTADILLLRQELLMLANGEHRLERHFYPYIPEADIQVAQGEYRRQKNNSRSKQLQQQHPSLPITPISFPSHPMMNPPTYEAVLQGAGMKTAIETTTVSALARPQLVSNAMEQVNNNFDVRNHQEEHMSVEATSEVREEDLCDLCGQNRATFQCQRCNEIFCQNCDMLYHNNPKRRSHQREPIITNSRIRDIPEVAARNPENFNRSVFENQLTNGSPARSLPGGSQAAPSQEQGGAGGGHSLQPTISGERLRPTLHSRPSSTDHDNLWTRRVNGMATDLMDLVVDPEAQKKKLLECLAELDREGDKYRRGIDTILSKADKKTSLVSHFQEKLTKIEDVKVQLKALCGYEDPPQQIQPSIEGISSEESWTFRSVEPSTTPSVNHHEVTVPVQVGQTRESRRVVEANLIDLTAEEQPPSAVNVSGFSHRNEGPLDLTSIAREASHPVVQPANSQQGGWGDASTAQRMNHPSAVEDPELQSVFSIPSLPLDQQTHAGLKRNLQNGKSETTQPAKLQRGSMGNEIASEFENMNIETTPHGANPTRILHEEFTEPKTNNDSDEESFHSAEEGGAEATTNILQNRLEEPAPKTQQLFIPTLSAEALQDRFKKEEVRFQTTQLLDSMRAGDTAAFRPEQVEVAIIELEKEGNSNRFTPNSWLERNWDNHVKSFIKFLQEKGFKISPENAEDVLLEGDYNFAYAYELIMKAENEQIKDLAEKYSYDLARKALKQNKGDKYHAWATLQKDHIRQKFLEFEENEDETEEDAETMKRVIGIEDNQRQANVFTAIFEFDNTNRAHTLNGLLAMLPDDLRDLLLEDIIEATTGDVIVDVETALHYLDNECMICTDKFPRSKITCLPTCGDNECKYCISCLETHLTVCIRDKNIRDIVCPVCSRPETNSDEETLTNFFNHIDAILLRMPDKRYHEIFQQKLRDFTLMRLPNFRWCSHCSGGFQFDVVQGNLKMTCPFCNQGTCYKCKKPWETQHDGSTCEQFQQWKQDNDPEFQAAGLARHLRENGIDCPDCKFRYTIAKGGCMHFKCTQCSHEFCSGCNSPFKHGRKCGKFPSCHSRGLHAHHPRDCLFFLRDYDADMLRRLLQENNIQYNTRGPNQRTCPVVEQKETPTGLRDDACGREVMLNCAGLCKLHYMEYLVNLVNSHGLDPADCFSVDQLRPCLMREDIPVPQRKPRESEDAYCKRLLVEVKKLPLKREAQHNAEMDANP